MDAHTHNDHDLGRADQTRCPYCGKMGCPAEGGVRRRAEGVIRYRRCTTCKRQHVTRAPHESPRDESFIA